MLGDPKSPLLRKLLRRHTEAIAVEMESGGVARAVYEDRPHHRLEFLPIRGISDYCNRKGNQQDRNAWKRYAAEAAAAFALAIIRSTRKSGEASATLRDYRDWFLQQLNATQVPKQHFALTVSFADDYAGIQSKAFSEPGQPYQVLLDRALRHGRLILHGASGAGKSLILQRLARLLLEQGHTPVLLNLRRWEKQHSERWMELGRDPAALGRQLDYLIQICGMTDLTADALNEFPQSTKKVILVDGLDRTSGERESREILDTLGECVRRTMRGICVIVTDRLRPRTNLEGQWQLAAVDALEPSEVAKHVETEFGAEA